jgi:nucleoside-triphosphatase THEP1
MIHIITGELNQGKTEKALSIYSFTRGDGFISRKIFKKNTFYGYEIVRLSTSESIPLAFKSGSTPFVWDEIFTAGSFSFSEKAFIFAESIIDEIIKGDANPVFIDEIGPLELEGKGFCNLLKQLLLTDKDIYITVRKSCLKDVIEAFKLERYEIISLFA